MLKIRREKLIKKDNKYYYNNELFNGVIFFTKDSIIKIKKICKNGQIVSDYLNKYFDNNFILHIDKDTLEIPNPKIYRNEIPRYYKGKPFTGVVYKFIDGFCIEETEYQNSAGADNIDYDEDKDYSGLTSLSYFKSGIIKEFKRKDKNFSQEFEWYENGNIKSINIGESTEACYTFGADLNFTEDGKIILLYLDEYFEEFKMIEEKVKFKILLTKNALLDMQLADSISLHGEDIDDDFLNEYLHKGKLEFIKEISFSETSINEKGYEVLLKIPNLRKVHMRGYRLPFKVIDVLKEQGIEVKTSMV
ncbi:MAG: Unknown protein [uncultured Sulfurovum sp.]|uniref:Uncharacterized protein n=1 Tax=uncultured Sulfurovum sp. TaxID=269237 RepID=A0A6S6T168_9BACT|nr:MAG: Unknown protein [uncultured Sulfurovum sp.]